MNRPSFEITLEGVLNQPIPEHAIVREKDMDADFLVHEPKRILSIDVGMDVLAACVDNTGNVPLLVRGKTLKSINQGYNKLRAYYTAVLRNGKQPKEGPFTSRRLEKLTVLRNRRVNDYLHKASAQLVRIAVERHIDTIIVGKNKGGKQDVTLRKADKQSFIHIPHARLYTLIKYKAERAWYRVHACGTQCLNGAGNILCKAFPHAFNACDRRSLLQPPKSLQIA